MSASSGQKYPGESWPGHDGAEPPLLAIDRLSLRIGEALILRDLSLTLNRGEILALTGESGSGKSMTALAAIGLLPERARSSGEIRLAGQNLCKLTEAQLCDLRGQRIGMVFQEPMTALNPVQTIGAQVAETILIHRAMPKPQAMIRAREVLTRVGLPPDKVALSRYPHELSGGQRQRVVIAMAIALRPDLLIADEPTTALDVTSQAQILDLLTSLVREDGMGLLMITHDLAVVAQMADRIAVMNRGEIVEQAPAGTLLAETRHPYTRALLAAWAHRVPRDPPRKGAPLLTAKNLRRSFALPRATLFGPRPRFHAVRDVSLEIACGERVGLVGESGCGKSTLTRALLGLEQLQGGSITLAGQPVPGEGRTGQKVRRHMQVVFQDPYGSFNPRHTVGRLIAEPFHLLDDPPRGAAREEAVAEALRAVGLSPEHANNHIHAFSGGQRQRIAIARALIIRPDLVIFDEAVSALDVQVRAQILDLIADLSRQHDLAYLFISHDLHVVREITDRVLIMKAGEIVETGLTSSVFDNPQTWYTKSLIAAAPVLPPQMGGEKTDAGQPVP